MRKSRERTPAELKVAYAVQPERPGLQDPVSAEFAAVSFAEMPGKKAQKNTQPKPALPLSGPALPLSELEVRCAIQLRKIGDELNFRQKLLNLIFTFLNLVT
ncbi:phorbol-12-myristate-13-acetate-induced protein 1 [Ochotona curzoniae]|uniref:phorbol-12-myristate-13-acetate-induced protein 1 n=1 Tax=Ochotona curzoniae TaxID=130825 RepID=UPI001B34EE6A|nr:phorbol-12-myristate-13-acetate-induced protein 1 [Ochotona curzoniae]